MASDVADGLNLERLCATKAITVVIAFGFIIAKPTAILNSTQASDVPNLVFSAAFWNHSDGKV